MLLPHRIFVRIFLAGIHNFKSYALRHSTTSGNFVINSALKCCDYRNLVFLQARNWRGFLKWKMRLGFRTWCNLIACRWTYGRVSYQPGIWNDEILAARPKNIVPRLLPVFLLNLFLFPGCEMRLKNASRFVPPISTFFSVCGKLRQID